MEQYYYNTLTKPQQNSYNAIKAGLQSLAPSFPVPLLENRELSDVFMKVRLDHPQLFYAGTFKYRYYPDSGNAEMVPEYLFEKGKIKDHQKALQARVEKLARPMMKATDMEKLLYIHDFICQNVHYDKLKKQYSHEIIGPLGHGVGVCEGIAKSVKILCDTLNIWCVIALSEANPENGTKYRHAWNIVKVDKKYYHIDCTFDNSLGNPEEIRYDYFLLPDKQIFRDHERLVWKMPVCEDGDRFYYKEKKLSFTKMEDVRKRSQQAVKKGKTLLFHWRGGYMTREIVQEFLQIFKEEAAKKDKHAKVFLNWAQAVVKVQFIEQVPVEELTMEEANEGEKD
ncbi:transglutaminase domain-containing protein [Anaerotignum sp.]|nr:transglutaminase domain-containing protein [Anaerotignum sp.]MBQ7758407.1 peptidase [Anaerotignum sp.]